MHGRALVGLSWFQNSTRELWLVRRIGEVLRLEAERFVLFVAVAAGTAVEEVAAVELDAGLRRMNLHHAAAGGIYGPGQWLEPLLRPVLQNVAVVIPLGLVRLLL